MALKCLNEERWIAAAKPGGSVVDLGRAFSWISAEDWPCPFVGRLAGEEKEFDAGWHGWGAYARRISRQYGYETWEGVEDGDNAKLPPEAAAYIAKMYLHWKMGID